MIVKYRLVVLCIDMLGNKQVYTVIHNNKFPERLWEAGDKPPQSLTVDYIDLDYQWIAPQLLSVDSNKGGSEFYVTYAAIVPHGTYIRKGEWVSIMKLPEELTPLALEATRRV